MFNFFFCPAIARYVLFTVKSIWLKQPILNWFSQIHYLTIRFLTNIYYIWYYFAQMYKIKPIVAVLSSHSISPSYNHLPILPAYLQLLIFQETSTALFHELVENLHGAWVISVSWCSQKIQRYPLGMGCFYAIWCETLTHARPCTQVLPILPHQRNLLAIQQPLWSIASEREEQFIW